ncbi:MAG: dCMP deaminase family protein [Synechococcales bacterium]|nr:dCMP deaminase family protein [Synechococcales bacterium]
MNLLKELRPTWDEYFLMLAKLAATRSTCLSFPVGAVVVKDKQVVATGYNGPPSKSSHCVDQGYCYPGLSRCDASKSKPSRAIHAEANAIAQAAKHGILTDKAKIYVTLEPCLYCLKLIISAGIEEVIYETPSFKNEGSYVRESFEEEGLITFRRIEIREEVAKKSATYIMNPISIPEMASGFDIIGIANTTHSS